MMIRDQMQEILRTAEDGLAGLATDAGRRRAYADAAALLEAARRVQQIGNDIRLESDSATPVVASHSVDATVLQASESTASPVRTVARAKSRKVDYPKFFREGDTLVKVGWSKSDGSEYEHKCPKRVLDVFVAELARIAGPGKRFVMDKILPLREPGSAAEFPTYQPYLALAFLRETGLIDQHGRSGYSIPKLKSLLTDANGAWSGIPSR